MTQSKTQGKKRGKRAVKKAVKKPRKMELPDLEIDMQRFDAAVTRLMKAKPKQRPS